MGKKKQKSIQNVNQQSDKGFSKSAKTVDFAQSNVWFKNINIWVGGIIVLTIISYLPVFSNALIDNWDDGVYITKNDFVKSIDIPFIFSFKAFYGGNYHPFVLLTNAVEYHFFKYNPIVYHLNNLIFHLVNIVLVFKLIQTISKKNEVAVITALFFGIHPMHVESVAWAAERKDVMYTFFYLLALMSYIKYIKASEKPWKFYVLSLLLALCSLFSKSAAVSFVGMTVLLDWFFGRKISLKSILDKIPYLALCAIFGVIALMSQKSAISSKDINQLYAYWEKPFLACYAVCLYFYKMLLPINLSAIYPYPNRTSGFLPVLYYLAVIAVFAIAYFSLVSLKKSKNIVFGLLFFVISAALVLQILPVGGFIIAERYSYVPYIGTFFIVGVAYSNVLNSAKQWMLQIKSAFSAILILFALICVFVTFNRTQVWKRGDVLFIDAAEKSPVPMALDNIGYYYYLKSQDWKEKQSDSSMKYLEKSLDYYSKCLTVDASFHEALSMRGVVYFNMNKFIESISDFNKALTLKSSDTSSYLGRANALSKINKFKEALTDYDYYIKCRPKESDARFYRGVAYFQLGRFNEAIEDFNISLKLNPKNYQSYLKRGITFYNMNNVQAALNDLNISALGMPNNSEVFSYRGILHFKMNELNKSIDDYNTALRLNPNDGAAYYNRAVSNKKLGRFETLESDVKNAQIHGVQISFEVFMKMKI